MCILLTIIGCENREKIVTVKDYNTSFIHAQVGMLRTRLFLQMSEAQSTGLQRPPAETATKWCCALPIKNLLPYLILYNSSKATLNNSYMLIKTQLVTEAWEPNCNRPLLI